MQFNRIILIVLISLFAVSGVYAQNLVPDKERERVAKEVIMAIREQSFLRIDALIPRQRGTYAEIIPNKASNLDQEQFDKLIKDNYTKFKDLFDKLLNEMKKDSIDPKKIEYVKSEIRLINARKAGSDDDVFIMGIFMKEGEKKFSLPLLIGIVGIKIFLIGIN